jgi:murein DD-endopeptidase MepM/ murein hydrolase activator NlpD
MKTPLVAVSHRYLIALSALMACPLVSCGGGGSGGGSGGQNPPSIQPTYAISVTASGLTGTAVLQNNGGDNLSVSADGTATFSTKLPSGSTYQVTVLTPPASEICTVANGSGTVGTAPVQSIAVTCHPQVTMSVPPAGAPVQVGPYTVTFPPNTLSASGTVSVTASVTSDPTIASRFDDGTAAFGPSIAAETTEFQITLDSTATPAGHVTVQMPLSSALLSQLSTNSSLTPIVFYLLPYVSADPDVPESIDTFEPAASSFASGTATAQIPAAAFVQNPDGSFSAVLKLGLVSQVPRIIAAAAAPTNGPIIRGKSSITRAAAVTCTSSPIVDDGSGGSFSNPLYNAQLVIVGAYGERSEKHPGVDIAATSVPVYAVRQGYIERVLWTNSGIFYTVVRHLDGTGASYLHLQAGTVRASGTPLPASLQVQGGAGYRETAPCNPKYPVKRGEQIAVSGSTGAPRPHLHLTMLKAVAISDYLTQAFATYSTSINPILRLGTLSATFTSSGTTASNLSSGSKDTVQLSFQDHQSQPQEIMIQRRKPANYASVVARSAQFDAPNSDWPALKVSWTQPPAGVTLQTFDSTPPYLVTSPWGIPYDNGQASVTASVAPSSGTFTVTAEAVHAADGTVNPPTILATESSAGETPQVVTLTVLAGTAPFAKVDSLTCTNSTNPNCQGCDLIQWSGSAGGPVGTSMNPNTNLGYSITATCGGWTQTASTACIESAGQPATTTFTGQEEGGVPSGFVFDLQILDSQSVIMAEQTVACPGDSVAISPPGASLGNVGGCTGGSVSGTFSVSVTPSGTTWTVDVSQITPPTFGGTVTASPNAGTGSGSFTVTVTAAPQTPTSGYTCSDTFPPQPEGGQAVVSFSFPDGSGHLSGVNIGYDQIVVK